MNSDILKRFLFKLGEIDYTLEENHANFQKNFPGYDLDTIINDVNDFLVDNPGYLKVTLPYTDNAIKNITSLNDNQIEGIRVFLDSEKKSENLEEKIGLVQLQFINNILSDPSYLQRTDIDQESLYSLFNLDLEIFLEGNNFSITAYVNPEYNEVINDASEEYNECFNATRLVMQHICTNLDKYSKLLSDKNKELLRDKQAKILIDVLTTINDQKIEDIDTLLEQHFPNEDALDLYNLLINHIQKHIDDPNISTIGLTDNEIKLQDSIRNLLSHNLNQLVGKELKNEISRRQVEKFLLGMPDNNYIDNDKAFQRDFPNQDKDVIIELVNNYMADNPTVPIEATAIKTANDIALYKDSDNIEDKLPLGAYHFLNSSKVSDYNRNLIKAYELQFTVNKFIFQSVTNDYMNDPLLFKAHFPEHNYEDLVKKVNDYLRNEFFDESKTIGLQIVNEEDTQNLEELLSNDLINPYTVCDEVICYYLTRNRFENDLLDDDNFEEAEHVYSFPNWTREPTHPYTEYLMTVNTDNIQELEEVLKHIHELNDLGRFTIGTSNRSKNATFILKLLSAQMRANDMKAGAKKVFIPAYKHLLKILATPLPKEPEAQLQLNQEKASILFKIAEALGNCNTPLRDLLYKETLAMTPELSLIHI